MKKTYVFEIEGYTPIIMEKFTGQKPKNLPPEEEAELKAYRLPNGNLAVPSEWIRGALINEFVSRVSKGKFMEKLRVAPRIIVQPQLIDLGIKDYEVFTRSVPAGSPYRGGTRKFCSSPLIRKWRVKAKLITTLPESAEEIRNVLAAAGENFGIGGFRVGGYGRFKVISFMEETEEC